MKQKEKLFLWALIIIATILVTRGILLRPSAACISSISIRKNFPQTKTIVHTLERIRHTKDSHVVFNAQCGREPVVTFIKYWGNRAFFFIESCDASAGLRIDTVYGKFMPESLSIGDKIAHMEGDLKTFTKGRMLVLSTYPVIIHGKPSNVPAAVQVDVKRFGGAKEGYTPGVVNGIGHNTDGLIVKVIGKTSGYGNDMDYEWFFLDDGSGVPNDKGYSGIEVYRVKVNSDPCVQFPMVDGTLVEVEGVGYNREVTGVGRIRDLIVRYDGKGIVSDQVKLLKP